MKVTEKGKERGKEGWGREVEENVLKYKQNKNIKNREIKKMKATETETKTKH